MDEIQSITIERPEWAQKKYLDELGFCYDFLQMNPMIFAEGAFFTHEGRISEEEVRKRIFDYLTQFCYCGLAKKVNSLVEVLKLQANGELEKLSETKIYCANGVYSLLRDKVEEDFAYCRYRLPVKYNPHAPEPVLWKSFLRELLEPEDILTLQEFMGYCLVPVNYAQKMLLIIGNGGEGKSRIGIVMRALLGESMANGSLAKLENSPFARADLQHKLLMVDDDLQLGALRTTNHIKSIITAEQPLDLEKKGVQSYQGLLYCRLMAFGNGNLRSLHDRSYGFFRRQIILTTKERDPNRVDDPFLAKRLIKEELEGIFLWCLEGLFRLVGNDMRFTISEKAAKNLREAIAEGCNITEFLKSEGYFRFECDGEITSRKFYHCYQTWCEDNMTEPLSPKSFSAYLIQNASALGIDYCGNIFCGDGKRVRGFRGVRACR